MMILLRFLGLRGVLLIALVGIVVALAVRIDVLTAHRDTARAELSQAAASLAVARAHAAQVDADRRIAVAALENERSRAVAAERRAAELRMQIARDAGTDRDAETAPVLRDAIRGLHRTRSRLDAEFLGRMPDVYRLVVEVDGKRTKAKAVRGFTVCRDLAAAEALELAKQRDLLDDFRRVSIRCVADRLGEKA